MLPPVGASRINDSTWPTFVKYSKMNGDFLAFGLQGEAITDVFKAKNHSCSGHLDEVEKIVGTEDVYKINGWSRFSENGSEASSYILAVNNGIVSDIGKVYQSHPDVNTALIQSGIAANSPKLENSDFEGYVRVSEGSEIELREFSDGAICELASNKEFIIK